MISYLSQNKIFRKWFGDFEKEELKKFIFLGFIFALVIGVYWALRPLKDGIFSSLVNIPEEVAKNSKAAARFIPWAKIVSLFVLFPIVMIYSKAVEKFHRHYMFYFLGTVYCVVSAAFGLYFMYSPWGLSNTVGDFWRISGWAWYVFVESYGSLMVALFWAFAADTTTSESAKRGFAVTVMLGQLGAISGPLISKLLIEYVKLSPALVVLICAAIIFLVVLSIKYFMAVTPKEQLVGFHGKDEKEVEAQHEPGFLEGLRLMLSQKYLLGIFCIIAIYEILGTIIDYNFKAAVMGAFATTAERSVYLNDYAVWVNLTSFLCLLFGINNIQRHLGVKVSLALMPFIIVGMFGLFLMYGDVKVLFWIMVLVKAINYALNGPTMKQLYVPTTKDVKYKSQAWIETFGSRGSKASGSGLNIIFDLVGKWFVLLAGTLTLGLGAMWFFIALYLGTTYKKAVDEKRVVC